jgi:hypothetical protein
MELKKLAERLEQLTGERVPENTIKKWAHTEEVIPAPTGGGRGGKMRGGKARKADWSTEALEQAAAVWWVREKYRRMHGEERRRLSKDQINVIKRAASVLDESPFAVYHLPLVTGPLSTQHIAPEAITITFVSDDFEGINLFPGKKLQEKLDCLNTLVIAWVATREKVRAWAYKGMSVTYILKHYPELRHLAPREIDFSQIDPWRVDLPCPWRIDRPARVALHWTSQPPKSKYDADWKFGKWIPPLQTELKELSASASDDGNLGDKIVIYENGVDTRKFFNIDVGDRKGYAKAEVEKTERKIEEKERELRRLGMDREKTPFSTFLAMEERPLETLTAKEKLILKTVQEWNGLVWYRARLKNQFGI